MELHLVSRLDSLKEAQDLLASAAAAAGLDGDTAVNIGVAVRESLINAIKHGNRLDPAKQVHFSVALAADVLEIVVADEGPGFDPESVPDPFAPENLLKPDGRGMLMMRSFMDEVTFSFPRGGGTVVRMRKKLR